MIAKFFFFSHFIRRIEGVNTIDYIREVGRFPVSESYMWHLETPDLLSSGETGVNPEMRS